METKEPKKRAPRKKAAKEVVNEEVGNVPAPETVVEKPKRTLVIGTVADDDSELFNLVSKFNLSPESSFDVEIVQMDAEEIQRMASRRASIASEKSVEDYVNHEPNKKSALELATSIEKNMNSRGRFFKLKDLYKRMRSSKDQVDQMLATLDLFGMTEVSDKPNGVRYVRMIISDSDIADNRLYMLNKQINFANATIKELVELTTKENQDQALILKVSSKMEEILKPLNYGESTITNNKN